MGHPEGRKAESEARLLAAAGRAFRRHGYDGVGVDGLARAAGVTSGSFYAHFRSKSDAFRAAVAKGLQDLRDGVTRFRSRSEDDWRPSFVDFYLSDRRTCGLEESCALQSLTAEVGRSDERTRAVFEEEWSKVVDAAAAALPHGQAEARADAIALLALLVGGVSLSRAMTSPEAAEEIAAAVRQAAVRPR